MAFLGLGLWVLEIDFYLGPPRQKKLVIPKSVGSTFVSLSMSVVRDLALDATIFSFKNSLRPVSMTVL